MKILTVLGKHNYGDSRRGHGYEFSNFLPALRGLGHEIVFFESFDRHCYSSFAELNHALLLTVEREQPDLIFFVLMGYEVWLETLEMLKGSGAVLMNWGTDDSWKYDRFARFVAPQVDVYVTTSRSAMQKAHSEGLTNVILSQWAASVEALHPPLPAAQCRYNVTFVGSAYGTRPRWIAALEQVGIKVDCFGHGWPAGPISAADIPRIIRESVISLNFADPGSYGLGTFRREVPQIKARTFEVPGAGGFLLTQKVPALAEYYQPGKEVAIFEGIADLVDQIRYFLSHPSERDHIALAGYERTVREHTYEKRFQEVLSVVMKLASTSRSRRAFRFDPTKFEPLVRAHATSVYLDWLRLCLVAPCRLLWGKERGARAARRLLFELSWRAAGDRTYRSRGLPGRLFYMQS